MKTTIAGSSDGQIRYWDFVAPARCFTVSGLLPGQPSPQYTAAGGGLVCTCLRILCGSCEAHTTRLTYPPFYEHTPQDGSNSAAGKLFLCRDAPLPPPEATPPARYVLLSEHIISPAR